MNAQTVAPSATRLDEKSATKILIFSAAARTPAGELLNVGDEALTEVLATSIKDSRQGAHVLRTVSGLSATRTAPPATINTRPIHKLATSIGEANLVVIGGGTLIQPHYPLMRSLLAATTIAASTRTRVVIAAVGAEPGDSRVFRQAARFICRRAWSISARDQQSCDLLEELSGRAVQLVADPILLHGRAAVERSPQRVAVNLRRDAPDDLIAELAHLIGELPNIVELILVPMNGQDDRDIAALRKLSEAIERPVERRLVRPGTDWRKTLRAVGEADLCIGMRLHFLYFAAMQSARTVAIVASVKARSFAEELDIAYLDSHDLGALRSTILSARPPGVAEFEALRMRSALTINQVLEASR